MSYSPYGPVSRCMGSCPPIMNDGRMFTEYRSSNLVMYDWARAVPNLNPEQFRLFMLSGQGAQWTRAMQEAARRQASCRW